MVERVAESSSPFFSSLAPLVRAMTTLRGINLRLSLFAVDFGDDSAAATLALRRALNNSCLVAAVGKGRVVGLYLGPRPRATDPDAAIADRISAVAEVVACRHIADRPSEPGDAGFAIVHHWATEIDDAGRLLIDLLRGLAPPKRHTDTQAPEAEARRPVSAVAAGISSF